MIIQRILNIPTPVTFHRKFWKVFLSKISDSVKNIEFAGVTVLLTLKVMYEK